MLRHHTGAYKRWLFACFCPALALLVALPAAAAPAAADGFVLGIFPRRPAAETREMFQPLADFLGQAIGRPVRLEVPPDFPAFWEAVQTGHYQLVHSNQYHYVRAHQDLGYRVIAMNQENRLDQIRATLWVRKDAGIRSVDDLRGQKIIFGGGQMAMVSYVMATDMLKKAGLQPSDYLQQFAINPTHALTALYYRQGAAAGLNRTAYKQDALRRKVDFSQLQPLLVSEPIPHHPWSVRPTVSHELAERIRAALVTLRDTPAGRKTLEQAGLTGINPASDADYDIVRQIVYRATGMDYRGR